ncbi:hypothetical protein ACFQ64_04495 [Streptomyces sp. NPDC056460]|uniref:hypothetical protein n=1 Tax=Streptomyces sp. NPDC056460 TaxID=3345825 RepID=UPI0036863D7B
MSSLHRTIGRSDAVHGNDGAVANCTSKCPSSHQSHRNLLKERDLAEGEVRRASLVHLVAEHQRRKPSAPTGSADPEDLAWVREHSRGRRRFTWNGMVGEVLPAQDVLDRIAMKP